MKSIIGQTNGSATTAAHKEIEEYSGWVEKGDLVAVVTTRSHGEVNSAFIIFYYK